MGGSPPTCSFTSLLSPLSSSLFCNRWSRLVFMVPEGGNALLEFLHPPGECGLPLVFFIHSIRRWLPVMLRRFLLIRSLVEFFSLILYPRRPDVSPQTSFQMMMTRSKLLETCSAFLQSFKTTVFFQTLSRLYF